MDWPKAKTILILILLALNIILLGNIFFYRSEEGVSRETIAYAGEILSKRGITLQCEIPLNNGSIQALIFENNKFENTEMIEGLIGKIDISQLDALKRGEVVTSGSSSIFCEGNSVLTYENEDPSENIDISDMDKAEKYLRKWLSGLGLDISRYILDEYVKSSNESVSCTFIEKYRNLLAFDNKVILSINKKGVTRLIWNNKKVRGFSSYSTKIMPAYQVLLKNFNDNEKLVITNIDLGFKGFDPAQDLKESQERPKWRVMIRGRAPKYFNARDGKEIEQAE